jgi:hypothetical protein
VGWVVVLLVFIEMSYACWEIVWQQYGYQPIVVYFYLLWVLPCFLRGSRWAWGMLFLFSVHILHEAIFLYHSWYYSNDAYSRMACDPAICSITDMSASASLTSKGTFH